MAIAGVLLTSIAPEGAKAQPFGRGGRVIEVDRGRGEGRREERREEHGRGGQGERGGQGDQGARGGYRGQEERGGGYRGQPYAPAPRGYAYPAPAYPYPQSPPPQAYAPPPSYAPAPRGYSYAPAPNSLGSGWRPQQPEARRQGNVPLGQVMADINRRMPGRMLDAGVEPGPDGRPAYRVRWAARGGRRIDFIVDAATGAIIGESGY